MYEAVLSLLITIMTLGILQQSLQLLKIIQKTSFRDQLRWHITQEKLQEVLGKAEIVEINAGKIIYKNKNMRKMTIDRYNFRTLRITTADKGGHEPIMTNLNKINIEKIQNLVIITTENKAGQKSQMCIINDP